MRRPATVLRRLVIAAAVAVVATLARAGHELPVYPSYYPHSIAIQTIAPERAGDLLSGHEIQAYLGPSPRFSGEVPKSIGSIVSLGSFVVIQLNPDSPSAKDPASACTVARHIARTMVANDGFVFHPYPVTPFHGDYLYHFDLAEVAKARFLAAPGGEPSGRLQVKAYGAAAGLVPPKSVAQGTDWDAVVEEVSAADLIASSKTSLNGWLGPPWVKTGWFQAELLLGGAIEDGETRQRIDPALHRVKAGDYRDTAERVNLEREVVTNLAGNCRKLVVGFTVKRQYFSTEFTKGIENIGFDSIYGFNSAMFIRTVKLKDFPWNGWLTLGINSAPDAAWNPIAGFGDAFGQLLWSAVGDPALLPSPYASGWMLNRVSDVQANSGR